MTTVRLRAGDYAATFRPDAGMTGTSLRYRGVEHVVRPEPLGRLRAGAMTGISLMHPWANRLGARRYRVAGRTVDLTAVDLPTDAAGLPLHGNLCAAPFVVERIDPHRLDGHRRVRAGRSTSRPGNTSPSTTTGCPRAPASAVPGNATRYRASPSTIASTCGRRPGSRSVTANTG